MRNSIFSKRFTLRTKALFNAMPIYDRSIKCKYIHTRINARVFQIWWFQELIN